MLERETGVRSNFNGIRSSFVTFLYDSDSSRTLRESAAEMLKHSTREAKRTYDRRRPEKKKLKALRYLSELAAGKLEENP